MSAKVRHLIPMAHVADVQRSIDFYAALGMTVESTFTPGDGRLAWAHLKSQYAELMFSRASEAVVPEQQAVLFYLYAEDLKSLREHLQAHGIEASEIVFPFYMPKGEIRVADPDGYVLLIGQAD